METSTHKFLVSNHIAPVENQLDDSCARLFTSLKYRTYGNAMLAGESSKGYFVKGLKVYDCETNQWSKEFKIYVYVATHSYLEIDEIKKALIYELHILSEYSFDDVLQDMTNRNMLGYIVEWKTNTVRLYRVLPEDWRI